jgi:hypothetical protein
MTGIRAAWLLIPILGLAACGGASGAAVGPVDLDNQTPQVVAEVMNIRETYDEYTPASFCVSFHSRAHTEYSAADLARDDMTPELVQETRYLNDRACDQLSGACQDAANDFIDLVDDGNAVWDDAVDAAYDAVIEKWGGEPGDGFFDILDGAVCA